MTNETEGYATEYYVTNPSPLPLTIICDVPEFSGVILPPNHTIKIPIFVPKGMRPWARNSMCKGKQVTWVGLLDKDAPHI